MAEQASKLAKTERETFIRIPRQSEAAPKSFPAEFTQLAEYVQSIKFGSVTLQIENGRIIQIDKNEKFRFDRK